MIVTDVAYRYTEYKNLQWVILIDLADFKVIKDLLTLTYMNRISNAISECDHKCNVHIYSI